MKIFLILCFFFIACQPPEQKQEKPGVLREYVQNPLDKANAINEKADERNKKMLQGLEETE